MRLPPGFGLANSQNGRLILKLLRVHVEKIAQHDGEVRRKSGDFCSKRSGSVGLSPTKTPKPIEIK